MNIHSHRIRMLQPFILLSIVFATISHAQDVEVNSADPDTAVQGTVDLDVEITGDGFDSSAQVDFFLTGTTNPGGIQVKKIKVRGPKKLIATIDVDPEAIVDQFDIEISLSRGRKGRGTTLFSVQEKPKPHEEPPPPPPGDGAACASSDDFPAMVYSVKRVVNEHKKFEETRTDLYLASSDGSCSIVIFSTTSDAVGFSYSQGSTEGRIIWHQNGEENAGRKDCTSCPVIRGVTFEVSNKEITTPLPLTATTIYTHPVGDFVGLIDLELSPDGSRLFYSFEQSDPTVSWLDTLHVIDLTTCSQNCSPTLVHSLANTGIPGVSASPAGKRVFIGRHDRVTGINTVAVTEEQSGTWSTFRDVVTNQDIGYASLNSQFVSAALWDHDGDGTETEVLAFDRGDGSFDIFDVENCSTNGSSQSCLAQGEATIVRTGIPGVLLTFTQHPSSLADTPPNVLVFLNGDTTEVDPDSGNNLGVLVPDRVVSDSAN